MYSYKINKLQILIKKNVKRDQTGCRRPLPKVGLMLAQRLRRWPSIEPTLVELPVFTGVDLLWKRTTGSESSAHTARPVFQPGGAGVRSVLQSRKAVSAHLKSEQILPCGFARQWVTWPPSAHNSSTTPRITSGRSWRAPEGSYRLRISVWSALLSVSASNHSIIHHFLCSSVAAVASSERRFLAGSCFSPRRVH